MLTIGNAALTLAFFARLVDDLARAAARRARRGGLHIAQERMLHGDHAAPTVAIGAIDFFAALGLAGAIAHLARRQAVVDDFLLRARGDLFKRQTQANAHIAAFFAHRGATARSAAEEARENIAHAAETAAEDVFEVDVVASGGAARRSRNRAEAVVLRALIGIRKHVVGFVQFLETILCIGRFVHIGVKFARLAAKRLLDLGVGCIFADAQNGVEVFCHSVCEPSYLQIFQRAFRGAHHADDFRIIHARRADDSNHALSLARTVLGGNDRNPR